MTEYDTGFTPSGVSPPAISRAINGFRPAMDGLLSTGHISSEKSYDGSYGIRLSSAGWTSMLNLNSAKDITVQAKAYLKGIYSPTLMMLLYDSNGNLLESATPLTTTGSWQDIQLTKSLGAGVYYVHFYTKGLGTLCYLDNIEVL